MNNKRASYLARAALAAGVLPWVLRLSASGRTAIDWIVIGLIACAILWNLVQLGRRLYDFGGSKEVWRLSNTLLFWIVGMFNTFLLRPEDVGGWRNWIGWAFILFACLGTLGLFRRERSATDPTAHPEGSSV